nr:hypothetical protein [Roseovarius sp. W115]
MVLLTYALGSKTAIEGCKKFLAEMLTRKELILSYAPLALI